MTENERIIKWFLTEITGLSSQFMLKVHIGIDENYPPYPSDRADFLRCMKLVEYVPEVKNSFGKISETCPQWKAIIENWNGLSRIANQTNYEKFSVIMSAVLGRVRMWTDEQLKVVNEFYDDKELSGDK